MDFTTIINKTSERIGEPENKVKLIITTFLDEIREEVLHGGGVKLPNFGDFCTKHVSRKTVVSPYLKGTVKVIPAHNTVRFVVSKSFKRSVEDQGRV